MRYDDVRSVDPRPPFARLICAFGFSGSESVWICISGFGVLFSFVAVTDSICVIPALPNFLSHFWISTRFFSITLLYIISISKREMEGREINEIVSFPASTTTKEGNKSCRKSRGKLILASSTVTDDHQDAWKLKGSIDKNV